MIWTVSPFLIRMSEHLRCQRDDLHEALVTQLAAHRAEDARTARLAVGLEDHRGVLVELDVRTVGAATLLDGADDDRLDDVTLLHTAAGDRVLDGGDDRVADTCVATAGTTEDTDAKEFLRTGVVGDPKSRLLLDHVRSLRLLEDLDDAPALRRGQRPGLHEEDAVADAGAVLLVVSLQLVRAANDLAVHRVLETVLDGDDDGLVHLVADDETFAGLAEPALVLFGHVLVILTCGAHATSPLVVMPSSRSRMVV